jgi:CHAT domain-containing protein
MGNYEPAESLYRQALDIARQIFGEQHPNYATGLHDLGRLYLLRGRYEAAEPFFLQALDIARQIFGEQHPNYATGLNDLAGLHLSLGRYEIAEPLYRKALEIWREALGEQHPYYAVGLSDFTCVLAATDRIAEAFNLTTRTASIIDRVIAQIFSIGSESQRMAFLESIRGYTYQFLSLLQRCPRSRAAARAAMDLVLHRKAIGAEALAVQRDAALSGKYPALREGFAQLRTLICQTAQKMLAGPGEESVDAYRQRLSEWVTERELLEAELASQIPEMSLEQQLKGADYKAVAHALPENTVLIEFARFHMFDFEVVRSSGESSWGSPRYLALVLRAQEPDNIVMTDLGDAEPIDRMIASFQTYICDPKHSADYIEAAEVSDVGAALRVAVFDPLIPHLGSSTRLFIAPDGELTRLPFEVLTSSNGEKLIDSYHISYLSTGRDVLRFNRGGPHQSSASVIIADPDYDLGSETVPGNDSDSGFSTSRTVIQPTSIGRHSRDFARTFDGWKRLQHTAEEGKKIADALHVDAWLQERALEGPLKATLSPRILHFATHGFFLANQQFNLAAPFDTVSNIMLNRIAGAGMENPLLRSGLALAGANTSLRGGTPPQEAEDGILTAEDVSALDLSSTDLVVLSACETGLGAVHVSEGVFGLRRTFALAGAKTLVMSLWAVPDEETKHLMTNFYARILRGEPRAEALRNAQLTIKAAYPNPYCWGAFICQGDPSPLRGLQDE